MCQDNDPSTFMDSIASGNLPPIANGRRPTLPIVPTRQLPAISDEGARIKSDSLLFHKRCSVGAPPAPPAGVRPRSNSDYSSTGDFWSSGRRSFTSSSNGRSSMSLSSGDASTVSTEKLWRRRKVSPRRIVRPVTPFPAEDTEPTCNDRALANAPTPPRTGAQQGKTLPNSRLVHQPSPEQQQQQPQPQPQQIQPMTNHRMRRKVHVPVEDCDLPEQRKVSPNNREGTVPSERRRRKSMPEIAHRNQQHQQQLTTTTTGGECRSKMGPASSEGRSRKANEKREGRGGEDIDCVVRDRIMQWLSEVEHANDKLQTNNAQEALSSIDEE